MSMKTRQMVIELSPESTKEAEQLSKKQNRTPEELISDLLRKSFSSGDVSVVFPSRKVRVLKATKKEEQGILKGREQIKRGQYKNLKDLINELDNPNRKKGRKAAKKVS